MVSQYRATCLEYLDVNPLEFGRLSPAIVEHLIKREENRMRKEMERESYFVSILLRPHTKKRVKPEDIWSFKAYKKAIEESRAADKKADSVNFETMFGLNEKEVKADKKQKLRDKLAKQYEDRKAREAAQNGG